MRQAVFRPRLGHWVSRPIGVGVALYFGLKLAGDRLGALSEYAFGVAAACGICMFLLRVRAAFRCCGLTVDEHGITDLSSGITLRFDEIERIEVEVPKREHGSGSKTVRVVRLSIGSELIRFGDLGPLFGPLDGDIVNTPGAAAVLALVWSARDPPHCFPRPGEQR